MTLPTPCGVLIVDKPSGMTSHDVVSRIRRLYGLKRVGHTGTLDPAATGVMVICLGQATRIAEYLSSAFKAYQAEIHFGIETDSLDTSGVVTKETAACHLTEAMVDSALDQFRGEILQVPPMVSAIKKAGRDDLPNVM